LEEIRKVSKGFPSCGGFSRQELVFCLGSSGAKLEAERKDLYGLRRKGKDYPKEGAL